MALLQISEPGEAPDPHQRRIAVGIDLGTTHSLVAAVRNGVAEGLPGAAGRGDRPRAVGTARGATHSLVAAVRNGVAECLPDAAGRVILPSAVRYLEGGGRRI